MNKKVIVIGAAIGVALVLLVAACSGPVQTAPVAYVQPPQPPVMNAVPQAPVTVVQAAPASHDGFFTGMLMGHLMSGGGAGGVTRNTTVINKSYTNVTRPPYVTPRTSYSYSAPSRSSPTGWSRSSSFGAFRGGRR
jgi:hypothetical protein